MIREIKKYKIKKIYPRFLWTKCDKCRKEFKKQDGWKVIYKNGTIVTVCNECAKTESKLIDLVEEGLKFGVKFPMGKSNIVPPKGINGVKVNAIKSDSPGSPPNQYPKK